MQRWTSLTVLLLVLLGWTLGTSGAQNTLKTDGNWLLQQCTDALRVVGAGDKAGQLDTSTQIQATWCLAYVTGFADGHTVATVDAAMGSRLLCPPDGWRSAEQLAQILVEWLRTHPTQLHRDKNDLTLFAFADAFPCPSAVAAPPQQTPSIAPRPSAPKAGKGK